ncbi:hypothetical protein DBV15_08079 [Temnothorax longispinosus]|uniref:Nephrin n=1 Tax=Temnothorax longispinosus TaxID=300112 RepID=A0A4S2JMH2_9HYME|nr:hypothetical protein DBV15_08079 [Temnothorax longispinosus]
MTSSGDKTQTAVSQDGNMTSSILSFQPTLAHHDKVITCRAENPKVQHGVAEDTWKLNVFFVPILHLQLGSNMNPDDIEEGDDVYFECKVQANPGAYKVVWKHNGNVIQNNAKNGVIVQQYDLALREVNRSQAGNYTCVASNVEGDGYSNIVELKIMYKPICVPDQKRIYGVARHEDARVICRVEAYPPPESFRWTFNNTEEMEDVPQARYKNSTRHTQSILTYRPVTEMDYGTVLCWASNTAGQQKNACIFHIIPAGKPEAPYNCTLTNQTTESLSVECTAGFDGGQPQHFLLEVFDQHTGVLQANVTSRENAAFTVQGLEPGKVLHMVLYAVNAKGKSEPALLEGFTLKLSGEVTYAELCLARPTTLSTLATDPKLASLSGGVGGLGGLQGYGSGLGVIVGGKPYTKEATVYACIDHNARPPKLDVSNAPSCATTPLSTANVLQDSTVATVMSGKQHHPAREVVTVRTPLISTQESCFTPLLGSLIGVVAALLLITVAILAALKMRSERRAQRPGDLPLKKATAPSSEDLYDADDRNPDVVPTNKGKGPSLYENVNDSDYQLTGSTSGTPLATQNTPDGLPPSSLPTQQTNNHLQGLPAYSHNDYNNYPTLPLSGEVTYAELCLARPTTLSTLATDPKLASLSGGVGGLGGLQGYGSGLGVIVGGKPYTKEATVYACIDHNARPPKLDVSNAPSCATTPLSTANVLQDSTVATVMSGKQHHPAREVVTVRTPLISTQESCV